MTETGRNYLSGSLFLSGVRDGNAAEKYTIRSVIGEGGSSVCYEAIRTKDNVTEIALRTLTLSNGGSCVFMATNAV